nr:hypothetical protein [Tanacetum cinerariifolium]
ANRAAGWRRERERPGAARGRAARPGPAPRNRVPGSRRHGPRRSGGPGDAARGNGPERGRGGRALQLGHRPGHGVRGVRLRHRHLHRPPDCGRKVANRERAAAHRHHTGAGAHFLSNGADYAGRPIGGQPDQRGRPAHAGQLHRAPAPAQHSRRGPGHSHRGRKSTVPGAAGYAPPERHGPDRDAGRGGPAPLQPKHHRQLLRPQRLGSAHSQPGPPALAGHRHRGPDPGRGKGAGRAEALAAQGRAGEHPPVQAGRFHRVVDYQRRGSAARRGHSGGHRAVCLSAERAHHLYLAGGHSAVTPGYGPGVPRDLRGLFGSAAHFRAAGHRLHHQHRGLAVRVAHRNAGALLLPVAQNEADSGRRAGRRAGALAQAPGYQPAELGPDPPESGAHGNGFALYAGRLAGALFRHRVLAALQRGFAHGQFLGPGRHLAHRVQQAGHPGGRADSQAAGSGLHGPPHGPRRAGRARRVGQQLGNRSGLQNRAGVETSGKKDAQPGGNPDRPAPAPGPDYGRQRQHRPAHQPPPRPPAERGAGAGRHQGVRQRLAGAAPLRQRNPRGSRRGTRRGRLAGRKAGADSAAAGAPPRRRPAGLRSGAWPGSEHLGNAVSGRRGIADARRPEALRPHREAARSPAQRRGHHRPDPHRNARRGADSGKPGDLHDFPSPGRQQKSRFRQLLSSPRGRLPRSGGRPRRTPCSAACGNRAFRTRRRRLCTLRRTRAANAGRAPSRGQSGGPQAVAQCSQAAMQALRASRRDWF